MAAGRRKLDFMGDIAVQLNNVSKRIDSVSIVKHISFEVAQGEVFGLIGPSGSGKTTTIRLICGVYEPTDGEVRVFGVAPRHFKRSHRERIGYMPQLFLLYPDLSVSENLSFVASLYGMGWLARRRRAKQVLEFVGLLSDRHKLMRDCSGGMQRRLELACTLVHSPDLLFLDEPTVGMDPVLRQRFWGHFRSLASEGKTLCITTNIVSEAEYCDRVAVLNDGRLVAIGTPLELRRLAFGGDVLELVADDMSWDILRTLDYVPDVISAQQIASGRLRILVKDASRSIPPVVNAVESRGVRVQSVREYRPPFDEVFARLVSQNG